MTIAHVYGLDLSPHCVQQARMLLGEGKVQVGDLSGDFYENGSFDVILMSHSLEHMHDVFNALKRAYSLLKCDGRLVIRVPNVGSIEAKIFGRWWIHWDPPRHLYHFDHRSLTRLLQENGFIVVRKFTGGDSGYFMNSLERFFQFVMNRPLIAGVLIKRIAKPLCIIFGRIGFGTELVFYAEKFRKGLPET